MQTENQLKELVQEKYSQIASQDKNKNTSSCCGSGCCTTEVTQIMADDYTSIEGYHPDADLGLGCGLPVNFAHIKKGDVVIDLGSGAGNDAFIARNETGETGRVIGIDFTPAMIEKACVNVEKLGLNNVEFLEGDIENIPLNSGTADVIISNCVLNLVPNKEAVFNEIFRVLKAGGHFSISDIVLEGPLPEHLQKAAEMYAGCVSGAIQKQNYLDLILKSGFVKMVVQQEKQIQIPNEILSAYLNPDEMNAFSNSGTGIFSITVYAEKPCCEPGACC